MSKSRRLGHFIVACLKSQGVEQFFCAPGSRNTPLLLEVGEAVVHFDERALAFTAVGYIKATGKPAAVIVTSGTAVGNLLPAVMEAHHCHLPLILMTADRPPEEMLCGSNQTTDQNKIFGTFAHWYQELDESLPIQFIASSIARALTAEGPIHFNCHFREPLNGSFEPIDPPSVRVHSPALAPYTLNLQNFEKGVILAGDHLTEEDADHVVRIANALKWPLLAEPSSRIRGKKGPLIKYYTSILKEHSPSVDLVLHFGDQMVSKPLANWLKKIKPTYYHISRYGRTFDPFSLITDHFLMPPQVIQVEERTDTRYLSEWKALEGTPSISYEAKIVSSIPFDAPLFIANSMPIRHIDQFFFPDEFEGPIFTNRGLSGIDGNIATTFGIALGLRKPVFAVLGDMTALYDMSSFALIKECPFPCHFLIVNNGGGQIFTQLPTNDGSDAFKRFVIAPHSHSFKEIAAQFGYQYYTEFLSSFDEMGPSSIIEVKT